MKTLLSLFVISFFAFAARTQSNYFRKVPVDLPSPECYRILQDRQGFIWIATEQGLCRFDGTSTVLFNAKNGLREKAVYALRMDSAGRVWVITKKGRLAYVCDDRIVDAGFPLLGNYNSPEFAYDLVFDGNNVYVPISNSVGVKLDLRTKQVQKLVAKSSQDIVLVRENDRIIPYEIYPDWFLKNPWQGIRFQDRVHPARNQFTRVPLSKMKASQVVSCTLGERVFFSVGSRLVEIDAQGKTHLYEFPQRILSLLSDSKGGIWIGLLSYGVYNYRDGNFSETPIRSLHDLSVSNMLEDAEGHIWCTTLEKGAYCCQLPEMIVYRNYSGLNRRMDFLEVAAGRFMVSSRYNELIEIGSDLVPQRVEIRAKRGEMITGVSIQGANYLLGYKEDLHSGVRKGNTVELTKIEYKGGIQGLKFNEVDGRVFGISFRLLYEYVDGEIVIRHRFQNYATTFLSLSGNEFLRLTTKGIEHAVFRDGNVSSTYIPCGDLAISAMLKTQKSQRVFVTTKGNGLYEVVGNRLVSRNTDREMQTDVMNDLKEDGDGNLWIATNNGLLVVPVTRIELGKAHRYGVNHGFISNVCDKLAINGDRLAVSTSEGLMIFPLNQPLESRIKPQVVLQSVQVNGVKVDLNGAELKHNQQSLRIECSLLSFHGFSGNTLNYRLEGNSGMQSGTVSRLVSLQNLQPGKYTLRITGSNQFGIASKNSLNFAFTILPPFWQSWWFILLLVCIALAVIFWVIHWSNKRTELRAEQANRVKIQLAKSQLSALQAQMNPHFLFNSISSIQNFIMSNKQDEAYNYLATFSKLIRNTLNNSRTQYITLEKEIESLQLYMELERQRYNNRFVFSLELEEGLDSGDILLPSSLIQPLLENAVWHGVLSIPSGEQGQICLTIQAAGELLRIRVTDNGGGLKEADPSHQSLAIKIIEEQLALLAVRFNRPMKTNVELTPVRNGRGTEATFYIPLLHKNENLTD